MTAKWYALHVRSRAEKKVAERLFDKGFEVFCPLKTEWRQWSDRVKKVNVPYFSSYVFVRFSYAKEKIAILQIPGVVRIVTWLKQPAVIRDEEMQQVKSFFTDFSDADIVSEPFAKGSEYLVRSGFLAGEMGVVISQNKQRVVLEVKSLNMRFSVSKKRLEKANINR